MKILYVENHSVFAATVTGQFLSAHAVTIVPSLSAARAARSSQPFDFLLIDYDLDDGKGDALVKEIRSTGDLIPIVGVSSHEAGNAALLAAGASAVCGKMEFEKIQRVLATMLDASNPGG